VSGQTSPGAGLLVKKKTGGGDFGPKVWGRPAKKVANWWESMGKILLRRWTAGNNLRHGKKVSMYVVSLGRGKKLECPRLAYK